MTASAECSEITGAIKVKRYALGRDGLVPGDLKVVKIVSGRSEESVEARCEVRSAEDWIGNDRKVAVLFFDVGGRKHRMPAEIETIHHQVSRIIATEYVLGAVFRIGQHPNLFGRGDALTIAEANVRINLTEGFKKC
jgi:hypothetical protein